MKHRFIMVDGLDGSGKGTIVDGLAKWAESKALKVLDVRKYASENGKFPPAEEIESADVILSCEPTYCYVGKAIREEIIRAGTNYSGLTTAHAFSLDREMLYNRVIIPAMKMGKIIFQERGVVSSLVYQPVQEHIQLSELLRLPGNKLAIQNAPSLLLIATVSPKTVITRLDLREKKDNSIFDNASFQQKIHERYNSGWLKQLFEQHGTKVEYISTDEPKTSEETKEEATRRVESFLNS